MKLDRANKRVSFRLISTMDVDTLFRFFDSLSDATRKIYGFPFTREFAEEWVREGTEDPDMRRYLVFEHPEDHETVPAMAGTVWLWSWTKQVVWFGIIIGDDFQNQGYGSRFMEIAIDDAVRSDKGGVLLTTHKANLRAQKLYTKHGFEIIGEDHRGEYLMLLNFSKNDK